MDTASRLLDSVRTTWDLFSQELEGVIGKILSAETAAALVVERAWFDAAVSEFQTIITEAQGLIDTKVRNEDIDIHYSAQPVVHTVPVSSQPRLPSDLKMTVLTGPNVLTSAPNAPVLTWGAYTYWAASYMDNRLAFCIVTVDPTNRVVSRLDKPGARYLWKTELDPSQAVRFTGQADQSVLVHFTELQGVESARPVAVS
jgi:hypothetical protein